jgi:hypothetical protein
VKNNMVKSCVAANYRTKGRQMLRTYSPSSSS